ncbi:hypothetical protein I3842_03G037400 [Carya illinoinensis]|uniref:DUF3730 domain-containing protein n=1 Tax=Carya illinoinensis TaxID=32201 RepID=A0A922JTU2_CARIL|nr:hypothetical protein I3842_03G037400 [Carya illinoinensis]
MAQNKRLGMVEVCEFLRPFLNYSILRIPFSDSSSSLFARHLVSSIASLSCSFPLEAMPILKLLMECTKYLPQKNSEGCRNYMYFVECMVDTYIVVLRNLAGRGLLITEAQLCGVEMLETVLSLCTCHLGFSGVNEPIVELGKRILLVQRDHGLQYVPELSSSVLSLFVILIQSELEHEQLSILKIFHFLLKWKCENGYDIGRTVSALSEELLFVFPAISLMSSPSKCVKGAATELLVTLEKLLVKTLVATKNELAMERRFPSVSTPGFIVFRLLQHLWFQDQYSSSSFFFLNFASSCKADGKEMLNLPRSWASLLRQYSLWIVDRRKSSPHLYMPQELFLNEMPLLLSAVAGVLVIHQSLGSAALDSLASIGVMDAKLGVPLLLAILFYNDIFTRNDILNQNMLLKSLAMLPSLGSHSVMIPLIVQTIMPMLHKDAKPTLYATATRLLCQTWETNDRTFGSLQGALLPKRFNEFVSQRNICISIAASIRDVCRKNPDRGVDLILSVSACIENRDPVVQALGFQSLAHLCEADVIDFYTAWDVIAKHLLDYSTDPALALSICLLLRWGAMDAEAYPEASKNVLHILWGIGTSVHPGHDLKWAKARTSAFVALIQYEVSHADKSIPEFKNRSLELLFSETNSNVLKAMEEFHIVTALVEVLGSSKSILVKGACGLGLGFSCQDLLTRVEATDNSKLDKDTRKMTEEDLVRKIVKVLSLMICKLTQSSSDIVESLSAYIMPDASDLDAVKTADLLCENCDDLEEDIWGVSGLVLGLASSVGAIYRAGAHDAVLKIKDSIISWIPHVNSLVQNFGSCSEDSEIVLSVGSSLALPIVVTFCQRVELMNDSELDHLVNGYRELISELVSVKASSISRQSLLMASCIGAGGLLACILNEGVHPIEVESVKGLLELFRECYSKPSPPLIHVGGVFGVVNAMGAGAGILVHVHPLTSSIQTSFERKESHYLRGPLLSSPVCEPNLTSLMQEIFLVAQNSDGHQLQQYAAWAVSFLRHHLWYKEPLNIDNGIKTSEAGSKSVSQIFSEDSVVMRLCLWLMHLDVSETGTIAHVGTVATVFRCLSRAPRLPVLDWGAIIRRCMKYEAKVAELLPPDSSLEEGILRKQCLQFSLAHANQFDPLATFLDEMSDLSRFKTLELNLRSCLLIHLADLIKVFSGSRIEKLFNDLTYYLPSVTSMLRCSCWKGLYQCLDEASLDSVDYISHIETCMEVLFAQLPVLGAAAIIEVDQLSSVEEWSEAIRCIGKARRVWLLTFLQVLEKDPVRRDGQLTQPIELIKKMQAKAKLVSMGSLPLTELGRLKAYIFNSESHGIWDVLIEVVAALQHAEESVKRQWVVDAVEVSCISSYPSTPIQFLSLLCGSCCKYMPLLIVDRHAVLSDLPVTLTSLMSDSSWDVVAESVVSNLWASTERIYKWATRNVCSDDTADTQPIDESESYMAVFLLRVMHRTCGYLKDHLPLDKQLKLANMVIPENMAFE